MMRDEGGVGQIMLLVAPMTPHADHGRTSRDAGKSDAGAPLDGRKPGLGAGIGGSMRADSWSRMPLVRMTNLNLEPGEGTLEDLIGDVDDGIYMETNKSWSIDDKRLNFQFGTQIAWEIKDGKLGRMLRDATYTGQTPVFWASLDAVAGPDEWVLRGLTNCGKGQPGQYAHVSHGTSPARFRNVQVGFRS